MFKTDKMYITQLLPTSSSVISKFFEHRGFELSQILNQTQQLGIKQAQLKG
jgi:hypothetical protein